MVSYEDGIPERELTLQLKEDGTDRPSVADGTQIKIYAESIKEVFQKEPTFTPIQKGPNNHFKGDKTLVTDTLKADHNFEITGWVYSNKNGKHSLDDSILTSGGEEAQTGKQDIKAEEFGKWYPLGDTEIKYDSETVELDDGTSLERGTDYEMNYSRGEIRFKDDSEEISSEEEETSFGPIDLGTQTVITDEFKVSYTFNASAQNIARLIRRMSQLGNPVAMRLDKNEFSAEDGDEDSHDYRVLPKKVQINAKAEKPDEYKLELELRKATTER